MTDTGSKVELASVARQCKGYIIKGWSSATSVITLPGIPAGDTLRHLFLNKQGFQLDPSYETSQENLLDYLQTFDSSQLKVVWTTRPKINPDLQYCPRVRKVWFEDTALILGRFSTSPNRTYANLNQAFLVVDFGQPHPEYRQPYNSPRPEVSFFQEFARKYPRLTAHMICHSLGYAVPALAARIVYDAHQRRTTYCEWIAACWKDSSYDCLKVMVSNKVRHSHHGYMADYGSARALVADFVNNSRQPSLASWF